MEKTIKLNTIYSADLYTRSRASELRACINEEATEVTEFINRSADVEAMMNKVAEGRSQERKRGISNATIHKFKDMESLSEFLIAM